MPKQSGLGVHIFGFRVFARKSPLGLWLGLLGMGDLGAWDSCNLATVDFELGGD